MGEPGPHPLIETSCPHGAGCNLLFGIGLWFKSGSHRGQLYARGVLKEIGMRERLLNRFSHCNCAIAAKDDRSRIGESFGK